jgi:hypothetical protein
MLLLSDFLAENKTWLMVGVVVLAAWYLNNQKESYRYSLSNITPNPDPAKRPTLFRK